MSSRVLSSLDTEGSHNTDGQRNHEAAIFSLAILISSYFVFNSVGVIDETSINELSLVTQLSKRIAVASDRDNAGDHALSYYTPKFLWLLRDFMLELRDQRGGAISSTQYLENALNDRSTTQKSSSTNKKIRDALLQFFKDRDCMTLVRPVNDEQGLKNLNRLSNKQLRPEFMDQLNGLREKILAKVTPKQLKGVNLNIRMFFAMVENYVDAINTGQLPTISSA